MPIGTSDGYQYDSEWQMVAHGMGQVDVQPVADLPVTGVSAEDYAKQADQILNQGYNPYEDFRQSPNVEDRRKSDASQYQITSTADIVPPMDQLAVDAGINDIDDTLKDYVNPYQTKLTPEQEADFQKKFKDVPSRDYDMRGYYKDHPDVTPKKEGEHYSDEYKMPSHITFSDESRYNGVDGNQGGHWGTKEGKETFTPGPTNRQFYTDQEIQDYFKEFEPNVELILPGAN